MLVDGMVIVELKSTEQMHPVFAKQVKTYLTVTGLHVGVLVNFGMEKLIGMEKLKDGYLRIVRDYAFAASIRKYLRASAPPREIKTSNLSHAELRRGGGLYYDGKRDNKGYP